MIRTIARYGARHVSGSMMAALNAIVRGDGLRGRGIQEFEKRFAEYHGTRHAISASYGRMAFYYLLKALELPPHSEILFPALTFWVVPEMARVLGFRPVFVDIDPSTFNMDASKLEAAITPETRAVVPTHLYGQPCDMDPIMRIARARNLAVIEDCAHALGATYRGRKVGTFGDASFFSFQMLKPLNTYGGGMAMTADNAIAATVRALAEAEEWPRAKDVFKKILFGNLQRRLIGPYGFTFTMFLAFYIASFFGDYDLSRCLWEKIRPLDPLPESYRKRYTNAQALIGLKMLDHIDEFNALNRANAAQLTSALKELNGIQPPASLPETESVYYQYCIRTADPDRLKHRAIRSGLDVEIMHVDICNVLDLFKEFKTSCPVAEATEHTLQLPVYSSLTKSDVNRVIQVISKALHPAGSLVAAAERTTER
jgi:perosamine synthetase